MYLFHSVAAVSVTGSYSERLRDLLATQVPTGVEGCTRGSPCSSQGPRASLPRAELQRGKLTYFHLHSPGRRVEEGSQNANLWPRGGRAPGVRRPREFKALFSGVTALRAPLGHQGGPGASRAGHSPLRLPQSPRCSTPALRQLTQILGPAFTPTTAISPGARPGPHLDLTTSVT